ncbi:MAG: hypothetical protein LBT41_01870 [Candidatus Methanoplasma sp.]|jgi:DNA polymerase III delta prime subunit|nr:hypothetical protein [Candidatus Methanoplasma sp.]
MAKKTDQQRKPEPSALYICPFCFSSVDLNRIHHQCTNAACTKMFLRKLKESGAKSDYMSRNLEEEIDVENSIFLGKDPAGPSPVTTKNHIIRNQSTMCDICGRPTYRRLCPCCHNPIPQGAEDDGSTVFVVLGPKGVGKSHYIAVLINELRNSFSPEFGATMSPATDKTTLKYRDMYYKRLYEEGRKLAPTLSFEGSRESREPMIYYLRFLEGATPRVYTLAFFDTAGEDLDSADKMMDLNLNSFISRASGIVFLVDPLQVPYIHTRIRMDNKPPQGKNVADMLSNIATIIRTNNCLRPKDQIGIPLAVALTKSDVLMKMPENDEEDSILFGPSSSIYIDRERGKYDKINFDQISAEIEEYMRRAVSEAFTQTVKEFSDHSYFAVSSLGSNPLGNTLTRGISPMRVEDPFIWLLNREGQEERR